MSIINIESMQQILEIIPKNNKNVLISFDIDGTLIEPGSDLKSRQAIEPDTINIMKQLVNQGFHVICLTARMYGERTYADLIEAGYQEFFHFHPQNPFQNTKNIVLGESGEIVYEDGILYACHTNKGLTCQYFLTSILANPMNFEPSVILHIDDSIVECRNMVNAYHSQSDNTVNVISCRYLPPGREDFEY
jgi:hypothetical protein